MHAGFKTHRTTHRDIEAVSARTRHTFPRHMHDQFGIGVIEHGAQRSLSGRGTVEAAAGQVITVNPGEVHDGQPIDGAARAWSMLYFSPALVQAIARETVGHVHYEFEHPVLSDIGVALHFWTLFRALVDGQGSLSDMLAEQTLLLLFSENARPQAAIVSSAAAPKGIERARQLIDDDPGQAIHLGQLAEVSGLSRYQVVRGFARRTGLTPHAYLVQRRLQLAWRVIAKGCSLADAAVTCGFSDQSHMTRLFRRTFGFSPGAYSESFRSGTDRSR